MFKRIEDVTKDLILPSESVGDYVARIGDYYGKDVTVDLTILAGSWKSLYTLNDTRTTPYQDVRSRP